MKKEIFVTLPSYRNEYYCDYCGNQIIPGLFEVFSAQMDYEIGEKDGYSNDVTYKDKLHVDLCQKCAPMIFKNMLPKFGIKINNVNTD